MEFNMTLKILGYTDDGKILVNTPNRQLMYLTGIDIEKTNEKLIANGMKPMQRVVIEESEEQE